MWVWGPWRPAQTPCRHSPPLRGSKRSASPLPLPLLLGFLHYWKGFGSQPVTDKRDREELEQVEMEQSQQVKAHLRFCQTQYRYPTTPSSKAQSSLTAGIKRVSDLVRRDYSKVCKVIHMLLDKHSVGSCWEDCMFVLFQQDHLTCDLLWTLQLHLILNHLCIFNLK